MFHKTENFMTYLKFNEIGFLILCVIHLFYISSKYSLPAVVLECEVNAIFKLKIACSFAKY